MTDSELADELIRRLNALCESPEVRSDIALAIRTRLPCSAVTRRKVDSIWRNPDIPSGPTVGWLGLLNAILGPEPGEGWGYISAKYVEGKFVGFSRTGITDAAE